MSYMFYRASAFNQSSINSCNISSSTATDSMFGGGDITAATTPTAAFTSWWNQDSVCLTKKLWPFRLLSPICLLALLPLLLSLLFALLLRFGFNYCFSQQT